MNRLDALVAERVMGWKLADRVKCGWGVGPDVYLTGNEANPTYQGFEPSQSISAAWEVVERMLGRSVRWLSPDVLWMNRTDASLAICLAALRAVGVTDAEIQEAMK